MIARIFMKFTLVTHDYSMNLSFNFHKDPFFYCGDICKIIFSMIDFHYIFRTLEFPGPYGPYGPMGPVEILAPAEGLLASLIDILAFLNFFLTESFTHSHTC